MCRLSSAWSPSRTAYLGAQRHRAAEVVVGQELLAEEDVSVRVRDRGGHGRRPVRGGHRVVVPVRPGDLGPGAAADGPAVQAVREGQVLRRRARPGRAGRGPAQERRQQVAAAYRDGQPVHQAIGHPDRHVQCGPRASALPGSAATCWEPAGLVTPTCAASTLGPSSSMSTPVTRAAGRGQQPDARSSGLNSRPADLRLAISVGSVPPAAGRTVFQYPLQRLPLPGAQP